MLSTSWIELNHNNLKKNIHYLQKRIGKDTTFVSVIKGNAYGHGIEHYVPMAEECGIRNFAVYDAFEASRALQVKSGTSHLIILGMVDNDQLDWVIENDIAFYVFTMERLEAAVQQAKLLKMKARIHIELETGMHRTGFEETELEQVTRLIKKNYRYLFVEGICTHYAGAESITNYHRIQQQISEFKRLSRLLKRYGIMPKYYHTASSASALVYPNTLMDLARIGIAQYGFWPSMEVKMNNLLSEQSKFTKDPLKTVLSWKSRIMSIKSVNKGSFVNYGSSFMTMKNMKFATIPVGYCHGFSRSMSNAGQVLIHGRKADVTGIVNMNMLMVNITSIPNVKIGDEVVLIGKQGDLNITVASFAELTKMVNYELLSRLPYQIPRIVI